VDSPVKFSYVERKCRGSRFTARRRVFRIRAVLLGRRGRTSARCVERGAACSTVGWRMEEAGRMGWREQAALIMRRIALSGRPTSRDRDGCCSYGIRAERRAGGRSGDGRNHAPGCRSRRTACSVHAGCGLRGWPCSPLRSRLHGRVCPGTGSNRAQAGVAQSSRGRSRSMGAAGVVPTSCARPAFLGHGRCCREKVWAEIAEFDPPVRQSLDCDRSLGRDAPASDPVSDCRLRYAYGIGQVFLAPEKLDCSC
jgi:hypothetical protein